MLILSGTGIFAEEEPDTEGEENTEGTTETEQSDDPDDNVEQVIPDPVPTETIHSNFYVLTVQETRSLEVEFSRDWFKRDASTYSHDLARLSLGLATAAFRPKVGAGGEDTPTDANLKNYLKEAHFTDLRSDDYDKNPSMYTVSTVMGHQKIGEGDEAFELIAVGVCGQGYIDEWESNFSIGTGTVHEGFDRSASLIYDRIFGYIARNNLQGPMKIWMSGFSRAAAVTNITAARLSDSPVFSQDSVFAYTFATPRTVRDENADRYKNIFNIVGKTDPVPNVPFADWGYRRYGDTFYLPVPETDSDYYEKRAKANVVYKQLTGIDYWYNVEADEALKIILAYCLELSPTVDVYAASLQEKLIRMWADRSPVNLLKNLLDLANDPVLINEKNRFHANMLLNYISGFALAYINESSVFSRWNPTASLGANILQAHTPELYVSWLFSTTGGVQLYNIEDEYTELYISSTDTVSLIKYGNVIETIAAPYGPDADVNEITKATKKLKTPEENVYLRYSEGSIVCTLPRDAEYSIRIPAGNGENYISILQLDYTVESQLPEKSLLYDYVLDQGDAFTVTLQPHGEPELATDQPMDQEKLNFRDDIEFDISLVVAVTKGESVFSLPWRTVAISVISAVFFIIALILFQLTYLVGKIRFNRRIKKGWLPAGSTYGKLPFFCVYGIFLLFMIKEFFAALYPDIPKTQMMFKLAIGVLSVTAAYTGYSRHKDHLSGWMLAAVILLAAADIITTVNIVFGGLLHIASYTVLTYAYWFEEKPEKKQIIAWVIMSFFAVGTILSVKGSFGVMRLLAVIYLLTALTMVCTSFTLPRRVFTGSLLLFTAGCLLMSNVINGQTFLSHILSLGTYYLAVSTLACANTRIEIPKLVPEESLTEAVNE
ncbi:MAG: lipase family protein [Solobacterium sp.]|nr:lipase family protein [Solobacterium sp.]